MIKIKKFVFVVLLLSLLFTVVLAGPLFSVSKQNGGIVPCLLGVFDIRMGYQANEKTVNVDLMHVLRIVPIVNYFMPLYYAYTGYSNAGFEGCCIGMVGGYTTATMMKETKGRTIEWLIYVPVANLYSVFVYISQTMGGKTWSQIVASEHLKR